MPLIRANAALLLDLNVLQEMGARGNVNVQAWKKSVPDNALRVSSETFFEKRLGYERELRKRRDAGKSASDVEAKLALIVAYETAYGNREVKVDIKVKAEVAKLLGAKQKNERDMVLAATARVYGMVVVTRNVADFEGRDVDVLNPFEKGPAIKRV